MTKADRSLFDSPAAARHDDPPSSRHAADEVTTSGTASRQREQVLGAVIQHPGHTSAELAALTGWERHATARRLPELRKRGLVTNGRMKLCTATGTECLTWLPVTAANAPASPPATKRPQRQRRSKRRRRTPPGLSDLPPATPPRTTPAAEEQAAELLAWFHAHREQLPSEPFDLRPGERVSNPEQFYDALATDIAAGPTARHRQQQIPAPRWAPLLADLRRLREITTHAEESHDA